MKLYHATPDYRLAKILKDGLKTGCETYVDSMPGYKECSELLYFTDTLANAVIFAREFITNQWIEQGARILEIDSKDIPEDSCYQFRDGVDKINDEHGNLRYIIREIAYKGYDSKPCVIPPDVIKVVERVNPFGEIDL